MNKQDYNKQITNADEFRKARITSKDRLLEVIAREADDKEKAAESPDTDPETGAYLRTVTGYLRKFFKLISDAPLFNRLEDWWSYGICISSAGISLFIMYTPYVWLHAPEDKSVGFYDIVDELNAMYHLIRMECRYLTIEEYARIHDCSPSTVNIWIRRGKIRSATKFGQKWMIPDMAEPLKRGYQPATYEWDTWLADVPKDYEFLAAPMKLKITKVSRVKEMFEVKLGENLDEPKLRLEMAGPDAAKLETYLIANPQVRYAGDYKYIVS